MNRVLVLWLISKWSACLDAVDIQEFSALPKNTIIFFQALMLIAESLSYGNYSKKMPCRSRAIFSGRILWFYGFIV
jgi:hypothetical protein